MNKSTAELSLHLNKWGSESCDKIVSHTDLWHAAQENPFVIYDTEFTAWEGSLERNWSLPGEYRELIQIGAVLVDLTKPDPYIKKLDLLIRPKFNPRLSDYIKNLTGISQTQLDWHGHRFEDAIDLLHAFAGYGEYPLFSYGTDHQIILENAELYRARLPKFRAGLFNIEPFFKSSGIQTSSYTSGTLHRSMGLELSGYVHNAVHDAVSVAVTLRALI